MTTVYNENTDPKIAGEKSGVFNTPDTSVGQEQQVTFNREVPKVTSEVTETSGFEDSLSNLINEVSALNTGGDKKAFSYEVASAIEKLKEAQVLLNSHSKISQRKEDELKATELHQVPEIEVRDAVINRRTDGTLDNAPFDDRLGNKVIDKPVIKGTDQP